MTNTLPNEPGYLTTMAAAQRYNVSIETLRHWVRWQDFPADSRKREGVFMLWNTSKIDAWLRSRPISSKGARPRWLATVQHPAA
jgi:hypothetical protein